MFSDLKFKIMYDYCRKKEKKTSIQWIFPIESKNVFNIFCNFVILVIITVDGNGNSVFSLAKQFFQ